MPEGKLILSVSDCRCGVRQVQRQRRRATLVIRDNGDMLGNRQGVAGSWNAMRLELTISRNLLPPLLVHRTREYANRDCG